MRLVKAAKASPHAKFCNLSTAVNNISTQALADTVSTNAYISDEFKKKHELRFKSIKYVANLADVSLQTEISGFCCLNMMFIKNLYKNFKVYLMSNSISDSIISDDLLQLH